MARKRSRRRGDAVGPPAPRGTWVRPARCPAGGGKRGWKNRIGRQQCTNLIWRGGPGPSRSAHGPRAVPLPPLCVRAWSKEVREKSLCM
jgi:hypothetical protein